MRRRTALTAFLASTLLLTSGSATCADAFTDLLLGKRGVFQDKSNPKQDSARFSFVKDPNLLSLVNPLCPAVTKLRLITSSQVLPETTLDCTKWKVAGSGFRYTAKTGLGPGGVKTVTYGLGKLVARIQDGGYSSNPVTGPVTFVETYFSVDGTTYCGRFETFKTNTMGKVIASGPTVPCQGVCGNGVVEAAEQCDDGNTFDGDCCSSSCAFEAGGSACADDGNPCTDDECDGAGTCAHPNNSDPCADGSGCTVNDTCSGGACVGELLAPWINEVDYDDFTGPGANDDRDEFVEIAGPAGTDLGGYRIISVEGASGSCLTPIGAVTAGNPHFIGTIPDGTVLDDDTGTGIGFFVACFLNTSATVVNAGKCDVVLPAPYSDTNLANGQLLNADEYSCPDGLLVLDPDDNFVDAVSWEGIVPGAGLYGSYFQVTPYKIPRDEGWLSRVSIIKTSSTLARATSAAEWKDPSELGPLVCDGQIGFFCPTNTRSPGAKSAGQNLKCGSPCGAFLDGADAPLL